MMSQSFESGMLEQGDMYAGQGPPGTGLKHTALKGSLPVVKHSVIKLKHKTRKPYEAALSIAQV